MSKGISPVFSFLMLALIFLGVAGATATFVLDLQEDVFNRMDEDFGESINIYQTTCVGDSLEIGVENTVEGPVDRRRMNVIIEGDEQGYLYFKEDVMFEGDFEIGGERDTLTFDLSENVFEQGEDYSITLDFATGDEKSFLCRSY